MPTKITATIGGRPTLPVKAFIDDSGGKNQGSVFVFAGWIGDVDWEAFSSDWARCLERPPKIDYLSMREAASVRWQVRGQFRGFSEPDRDQKLRDLAGVIREYRLIAYGCSTDLDAFDKSFARAYLKPFNHPYFWPFQVTILGIGLELANRGFKVPAEIIFDEHNIFAPRVKKWYPSVREAMEDENVRAVLPLEPIFKSDKECLPLQAADMLAWLWRTALGEGGKLNWLIEEFGAELSAFSQSLGPGWMNSILERSYRKMLGE